MADKETKYYEFPDGIKIEIPFPLGLSGQQEKLMEELYWWWENRNNVVGPNIFLVKGFAGVGKTSVIKFFLQYLVESKKMPKGFALSAPSHQARKQLFRSIRTMKIANKFTGKLGPYIGDRDARDFFKNRTFTTQAAFQVQLLINKHGSMEYVIDTEKTSGYSKLIKNGIPVVSLWVIDEVSMVSDALEIDKIKGYSEVIPVIIMGDPAQLRNPKTQKLSPLFSSSNVKHSVALKEVMRTGKDNPLIDELTAVRSNIRSVASPLSYESKRGPDGEGILYFKKGYNVVKALFTSEEYKTNRSFVKVVAKSNEKVALYNKTIRAMLGLANSNYTYTQGDTLMGYSQPVEIFYNSQEYIVENVSVNKLTLTSMINTTFKNAQKVGLDEFSMENLNSGKRVIYNIMSELEMSEIELIPYTLGITESDSIFEPVKLVMFIFDMKDPEHMIEFDKTGRLFTAIYDRIEDLKKRQKGIYGKKKNEFWRREILPTETALKLLSATLQVNENIYRYGDRMISESDIEKTVAKKLAEQGKEITYERLQEYIELVKRKAALFKEKSIDYGYAITAYKSQGATYTNTVVDLENIEGKNHYWREKLKDNSDGIENLNSEIYVAMSRSSKATYAISQYTKNEYNVEDHINQSNKDNTGEHLSGENLHGVQVAPSQTEEDGKVSLDEEGNRS